MRLSGAEIIWESLLKEGCDLVFGYPGGAILPAYDAISNTRSTTSWSATSRAPRTWPTATRAPPARSAW